ncbi:hypothetical protein [Celerinatantimonas yamalensis]|uniref:Uncharacterized protein n=1 Tax=Celerinatantimonas yamalensis TaxID=559956 RepID=A0ABW9G703_9GAMM
MVNSGCWGNMDQSTLRIAIAISAGDMHRTILTACCPAAIASSVANEQVSTARQYP